MCFSTQSRFKSLEISQKNIITLLILLLTGVTATVHLKTHATSYFIVNFTKRKDLISLVRSPLCYLNILMYMFSIILTCFYMVITPLNQTSVNKYFCIQFDLLKKLADLIRDMTLKYSC